MIEALHWIDCTEPSVFFFSFFLGIYRLVLLGLGLFGGLTGCVK